MRRRSLGKTGLSVSELALGTWGLSGDGYGNPVAETEQDRVIDRARAFGIDLFETADSYGDGAMESRLGARLAADGSAQVATKIGTDRKSVPPRKRFEPAYLRAAFEQSRARLRRDVIDVLLLHNPAVSTVERGEATALLSELREAGAIRAWGVSAGSPEVARQAIARGAEVIELAYNAFFTEDLHELHTLVVEGQVGILARSVLAHGLLCGYWSPHKQFPEGDHRAERWTADELRRRVHQVRALRSLVGGAVYTTRGAALRYALTNEDISTAVLGPRNAVQLDQLVREAGKEPPYLDEQRLQNFAARLQELGVGS